MRRVTPERIFFSFVLSIILLFAISCNTKYEDSSPVTAAGPYNVPEAMAGADKDNPTDATNDHFFYFSYDDSASTAGAELAKYNLNHNQIPDSSLGRAYEFLNFEELDGSITENLGLFDTHMGIWVHLDQDKETSIYELGTYIASPTITKAERQNVVITLLLDVSGSMGNAYAYVNLDPESTVKSRLDLAKYAMKELYYYSLKDGDVVSIVQFSDGSTEADVLLEGWTYSSADITNDTTYLDAVNPISTIGATNIDAGITMAYKVANRNYDVAKSNRVIILTDAYANTGETNSTIIANNISINNMEGIYFSGLGIGADFQEAFLNELTDIGKGAYFSLITPNDAKRAFNSRFIALVNIAAKNVHFRLDYPFGLIHTKSAAEEVSQVAVQPTNFSYNSSQFFLESFILDTSADISSDISQQTFKLTINYSLADGTSKTEITEKTVQELLDVNTINTKNALLITTLADLIAGKTTCADSILLILTHYAGFTNPLADEYYDLINKFCLLSGNG
ncbi:MAG: VWA domain-containing protein [Deltaproteobacteria bacterium]|nr:VWA domain-containing protein [Deltaproteobacteria bacterium]